MKKTVINSLLVVIFVLSIINLSKSQIIISQIYEGISNNKFIEITNVGSAPVNLSNLQYNIRLYSNKTEIGSNTPQFVKSLTGTLNAGQCLLIRHELATAPSYALSYSPIDTGKVCNFNGEGTSSAPNASTDIIALYQNNTLVDVFAWGTFNYKDDSWVRIVNSPNPTWTQAEWMYFDLSAVDTASPNVTQRLGFHTTSNLSPAIVITSPQNNSTINSSTVTINFTVYNFNVSTPGNGDGYIQYKLNNGSSINVYDTNPIELTGLSDGQYTFYIELVDNNNQPLIPPAHDQVNFTINTSGPQITPIYDIQYTTNPTGDSPYNNQVVTTKGIVTGVHSSGYFIQEGPGPWKGIYIYDNTHQPSMGDEIILTGTVTEYYNLTEIKNITFYDLLSTNNPQPSPSNVSVNHAKNEQYEGVLVQLQNVECTFVNPSGWFKVAQGTDTINVDKLLYQYPNPTVGTIYNITGIIHYSFSTWRIEPRNINDISVVTNNSDNKLNKILSIYPSPAKNTITISYENIKNIEIYNMLGQMLTKHELNSSLATIDISSLPSGVYFINIITDNNKITRKFIKE